MFRKIFLIVFILIYSQSFSQEAFRITNDIHELSATLVNINHVSMWVQADGILSHHPDTDNKGLVYPRGTAGVIWQDGMVWGGFVNDGNEPELRVGGQTYQSGTVPGRIINKGIAEDPTDPGVRCWRIRRDWHTADLILDAAEYFNISADFVTKEQIDTVRARYKKDWNEWPWQKGAPFYDTNHNGKMDTEEQPGLLDADQVVWFVANDLEASKTDSLYGSPPIGLEMQVTLWAYNRSSGSQLDLALQNTIFKRVKLIYKGRADSPDDAVIDSMFIAQWVDPDLGAYFDDFAGCDTTLQLGYSYNSTALDPEFQTFDIAPPAFGYCFIQGPIQQTNNPSDRARFNFSTRDGFINLPMTFFWHKATGSTITDPDIGTYSGTIQMYNLLNGFTPRGGWQFVDLNDNPVKFMVSGDPVSGSGWIDGMLLPAGDRRFMMSSGPFTMALGDTQEVNIAMVGGTGADHLTSVSVMKYFVNWVRNFSQWNFYTDVLQKENNKKGGVPATFHLYQNYPNPFNAETTISFELPERSHISLTIYNLLGQNITTLFNEVKAAGTHSIRWDGTDAWGVNLPSGVYVVKMNARNFVQLKKMLLLR